MQEAPSILVTGITGFIAKHCALELLRHGYRVRGTLRSLAKADAVRSTLARHVDVAGLSFVQAELLSDAGWPEAMQGLAGVLHVASPFPAAEPKTLGELTRPAVEGTLRVLRAAHAAGVPRFIQTSSTVAVQYAAVAPGRALTEDDWSDADGPHIGPYARSKTLAERAARDYVAAHADAPHFASVNPGLVLGPLLDADYGTSANAIRMFLRGKYPACPRLSYPVVDVRDVARAHRLALQAQLPSGARHLCLSGTAWFSDMMRPIKAQLGRDARRVPTREMPDWLVRTIALVDPAARAILHDLGRFHAFDNQRTRRLLNMPDFIPVEESAPAMARSLVELGLA